MAKYGKFDPRNKKRTKDKYKSEQKPLNRKIKPNEHLNVRQSAELSAETYLES